MSNPLNPNTDLKNIALRLLRGETTIEGLEAEGQAAAVESKLLPAKCSPEDCAGYEALGFVFGDVCKDDDLWREVTFPEGWTVKPTDHRMHNDIVDEHGNRRGSYFYKAAFYDRDAILYSPCRRFKIGQVHASLDPAMDAYERRALMTFEVRDTRTDEQAIMVRGEVDAPRPVDGERGDVHFAWWAAHDALRKALADRCKAWLDKFYPDHANPAAYWGEGEGA